MEEDEYGPHFDKEVVKLAPRLRLEGPNKRSPQIREAADLNVHFISSLRVCPEFIEQSPKY